MHNVLRMNGNSTKSPLEQKLIDHISQFGPITFDSFMESALYDPEHGYYPTRRRAPGATPVGVVGDYFTSPVSHPAFGALIALQLEEMWRKLEQPHEFTVLEMGAGDGTLAADIIEYTTNELPDFAEAMTYVASDLAPEENSTIVQSSSELPRGITGCVLSNELIDAFPVSRFQIVRGEVMEIFVDWDGTRFVEVLRYPSDPELEARVAAFAPKLADGYRGEVNLRIGYWADVVSDVLDKGFVLTIDYGFDRQELYKPERVEGSLRCYYQHTLSQNPLGRVGRQDITSHVDFTAVDHALHVDGLSKVSRVSQAEFLENIGINKFFDDPDLLGQRKSELEEEFAGFGSLISSEGFGGFQVAVHSTGAPIELTGVHGGDPLSEGHTTPLLNTSSVPHSRLLRASGPFSGQLVQQMPTWEQLFSDQP